MVLHLKLDMLKAEKEGKDCLSILELRLLSQLWVLRVGIRVLVHKYYGLEHLPWN